MFVAGIRLGPTPDLANVEGFEGEFGDDPELVAAALKGVEEVRVGRAVGVDDAGIGEDELGVEEGVGGETLLLSVPADGE